MADHTWDPHPRRHLLTHPTRKEAPVMQIEERWTGWWAECDQCDWKAGPCNTQAEATAHADRHELAVGEVRPEEL